MSSRSNELFEDIKKSGNLPSLPEILVKLLEACEAPETSLPDIASIISKDPALSFKVLQLVNSAYYGLQRNFVSIRDAVVYLGINSIKNLAVTTCIHQVFSRKRYTSVKGFKINTFWWKSLLCATLARRIAKRVGYANLEEAYLSGLLYDIGRLVLVATYPEKHKLFLFEIEDVPNELWAEEQIIGTTHCEIGALLVETWKLNSLVAEAIRFHHAPLEKVEESFPLVKIVYLATMMQEQLTQSDRCLDTASQLFDMDQACLDSICSGACEEVESIAKDLGIKIEPPPIKQVENYQPSLATAPATSNEESGDEEDALARGVEKQSRDPEKALSSHVKNLALLSGFLEELFAAKEAIELIEVFETSAYNLFHIDKVLFFLVEKEGTILKGWTSGTNKLKDSSAGLLLPLQRSSSSVAQVFRNPLPTYLTVDQASDNPADRQLLALFATSSVLLLPIRAHERTLGVVVLGMPEQQPRLPGEDLHLLNIIARQVGLSLCLEFTEKEKAAEIEREKKAAISMTARKFAHEINNPLGIISNYLTTLRLKTVEDTSIQEELTVISEEIDRIAAMISQLDLFSGAHVHRLSEVDLNGIVGDVVKIFRKPLESSSNIALSFAPDLELPMIRSSEAGIKQVLINLIKNAVEALQGQGTIRVSTELVEPPDDATSSRSPLPVAQIIVEDSGPGLPEKVLQNLYAPFTTTKGPDHSGLGLSIVKKMVTDLGGTLDCQSSADKGTRFLVSLPVAADSHKVTIS